MKNKVKNCGDYSIIYCLSRKNKTFEVLVDNDIIEKLINKKYSIYCHWYKNSNEFYADITEYLGKDSSGKPKYRQVFLHKLIMGFPKNCLIDHINRNTLDNRRNNLRKTNKENNSRNRRYKNSNNTSGYRNVTWISGWWRIQLQIDGKNHLFPENRP